MIYLATDAFNRVLSPYLHQDWYDEFKDSSEAILNALKFEPKESFAEVCIEIQNILSSDATEEEIETILRDQAGCYFYPESEGYSYRIWLKYLYSLLVRQN